MLTLVGPLGITVGMRCQSVAARLQEHRLKCAMRVGVRCFHEIHQCRIGGGVGKIDFRQLPFDDKTRVLNVATRIDSFVYPSKGSQGWVTRIFLQGGSE